jgi:tetratricopeptide (TPR) repeat protein
MKNEEQATYYSQRAIAADPDDPMLLYNVACNYAVLGKNDDALSTLEQAVDRGYGDKEWMEHDSDLEPLRSTPRYQAILKTL